MYNLVDIVHLKTGKHREDITDILTSAMEVTKEYMNEGHDVLWANFCLFTQKKKAKTKKEAKEWTEFPYLALGDKARCIFTDYQTDSEGKVLFDFTSAAAQSKDTLDQ